MNTEYRKMKLEDVDWIAKLTSRKFFALLVGFITPLLLAFGFSDAVVTQVAAIVASAGAIVAYIFGESKVDSAREESLSSLLSIEMENANEEDETWGKEGTE